jgi:hypothetical protein
LGAALPFKPRPAFANPPRAPLPTDDPWQIVVAELSRTLPSGFVPTLQESRLEAMGEMDNVDGRVLPHYRLIVPASRAALIPHFARQAGMEIQRRLSTVLRQKVFVEIVAEEEEELP